jgi:hypothetical protein
MVIVSWIRAALWVNTTTRSLRNTASAIEWVTNRTVFRRSCQTPEQVQHQLFSRQTIMQLKTSALVIGADAFFSTRPEKLGALTPRHFVPAIFHFREFEP